MLYRLSPARVVASLTTILALSCGTAYTQQATATTNPSVAQLDADTTAQETTTAESDDPSARYDLIVTNGATAAEILNTDQEYDLQIDYVTATYTAEDNDVVTVGISGNDQGNLPNALNAEVVATLSDLQADQDRAAQLDPMAGFEPGSSPEILPTDTEGFANDVAAALQQARDLRMPFDQVVVTTKPETVPEGMAMSDFVAPERTSDEDGSFAQADGTCEANWSPYWAQTRVGRSSVEYHRYAVVEFYWNRPRMRNTKCRMNAIEPDFVLNNYDHTYNCGEYGCFPVSETYMLREVDAWASNMPKAYKDTQASDPRDEFIFTVGSQGVDNFRKRKRYTTYVRASNGNDNPDNGKLLFQDMKRCSWWYPGISPAWGLCADDFARYIPAWEVNAPGVTTYSFG